MKMTRSKWFLPGFALALGLVMFAAQWLGGNPEAGLGSLAIMAVFGAFLLIGGRSETIRGLRGDGSDERFRQIDLRATAFAGGVVIVAIIVAFVVEVARGHERVALHLARRGRRSRVPRGGRRAAHPQLRVSRRGPRPIRPPRPRGRSSRHVQERGSLSSRQRISFVPWRNRFPCTLS